MDKYTTISICFFIFVFFGGLTIQHYIDTEKDMVMAKSGLVQKVEGYRVLWVKPDGK